MSFSAEVAVVEATTTGLADRLRRNRLSRRDTLWLFGAATSATLLQGCAVSPVTGERILVAINIADEPLTIVAPNSNLFTSEKPLTPLYGNVQATISDLGLLQIELPARSGGLLIEG